MDAKISEVARIQHIGWPTGIIGGLLLVSLGLELLARQVFGQTDVGTLLWALYLGFWSFVLGTTGFLLLAAQWLIEWRRFGRDTKAMNVPKEYPRLVSNSGALNQIRRKAEPCTQAHEPDMVTSSSA